MIKAKDTAVVSKKTASEAFNDSGTLIFDSTLNFSSLQKKALLQCLKAIKGLTYREGEQVFFEAISQSKKTAINQ